MTTPTATPWHHPACLSDEDLLKQCDTTRGRAGGPGGQHRNKVETLVMLHHRPSGQEAHAGERRSQMENKAVALWRLRLNLALAVRTGVPAGEIGSALWKSRLVRAGNVEGEGGRISCNPDHHDYPALLAEAMDVMAAAGWDHKKAALRLGCSPSQLLKLVKDHPSAMVKMNQERTGRGMHGLK
jgi:hypothetical protein